MAKKTFWSNFKLRSQLLRIWFMKNLLVWIQIFLLVCAVLILTGNINDSTPILGTLIYPIFKPLIDEITILVQTKEIDNLMDFFAIVISLLTSIGLAMMKVRNLAQSDIKNDKLKLALVKAHLYFNADGKLVKKTEAMVGYDIDGDGLIDGKSPEPTKGILSGLVTAAEEFKIITTADFSGTDEENIHNYNEALKEAGLKDNADAIKVIDETIKEGTKAAAKDAFNAEIDKRVKKNINDKTKTTEEKIAKDGLLASLRKFVNKLLQKKETVKKDDAEVLSNNIDRDAEYEEKKEEKPKSILDMVNKTNTTTKTVETKKPQTVANDVSSYLAQFRK